MNVKSPGSFSRSSSVRSSRRSNGSQQFCSSPLSSPIPPKSPTVNYQCTVEPPRKHVYYHNPSSPNYTQSGPKSPVYNQPRSPATERLFAQSGNKSPNVKLSSPNQTERVFDFCQYTQKSSSATPKSPRSPRVNYCDETPQSPPESHGEHQNFFNFNLQSPPKPKLSKVYHRQQFQSSKNDSNSSKSSLEYKSTTKHPNGDYQDIEYKICSSLDSDSQQSSDYHSSKVRYSSLEGRHSSRHSSIKEKLKKPRCNIRTNPGYDERYGSSKSINESTRSEKPVQRCRKSTSDLTDMTDDAGNTTMTSLSRPSSPRRKGSVKGGLAYLASRRGSRDSLASNMSNVSNEDIGPLNFQNTARGRQRRTSNFLELPGELFLAV